MTFLSAVIALLKTTGSELGGFAWADLYLNNLVSVETWFYNFAWVFVLVGALMGIVAFLAVSSEGAGCCGCLAFVFLVFPLLKWISLKIVTAMASSIDPTGITNQAQLIISAGLFLLIIAAETKMFRR